MEHSNHTVPEIIGTPALYAVPLDAIADSDHHHQSFINRLLNWAGATSVALAITPLALQRWVWGRNMPHLRGIAARLL
jgi:hypothetical protein